MRNRKLKLVLETAVCFDRAMLVLNRPEYVVANAG